MSKFDKKYLELSSKYKYQPDELIEQGWAGDAWNWVKGKAKSAVNAVGGFLGGVINIIKKGPAALLDLVKGWFTKSTPETSTKYASMASKIVNYGTDNKIVSEGIGDWFKSTCNQVSTSCKIMTSQQGKKKFLQYLIHTKKFSKQSWLKLDYSKQKQILKEYAEKQVNIINQNKELITQMLLTGTLGLILITLIIAPISLYFIKKVIWPSEEDKAKQRIKDHKAQNQEKLENRQNDIQTDEKMQVLDVRQLTRLFKGCTALK